MLCQFCYSDISADSTFCSHCGERQADSIAEQIVEEEADHLPHDYSDRNRFFLVLLTICGCCAMLVWWRGSHEQSANKASASASYGSRVRETEAVAACELAVKRQLVSSESYKTRGMWTISIDEGQASVVRDYSATNRFGARIDGTYYCRYDAAVRAVTSLTTS